MFRRGNVFLDFYIDAAERLLRRNNGPMPPQFVGPKLLTALHNVVQCPVLETAGMLSPPVVADLLAGGGDALTRFRDESPVPVAGANLCASLLADAGFDARDIAAVIDGLLARAATL